MSAAVRHQKKKNNPIAETTFACACSSLAKRDAKLADEAFVMRERPDWIVGQNPGNSRHVPREFLHNLLFVDLMLLIRRRRRRRSCRYEQRQRLFCAIERTRECKLCLFPFSMNRFQFVVFFKKL